MTLCSIASKLLLWYGDSVPPGTVFAGLRCSWVTGSGCTGQDSLPPSLIKSDQQLETMINEANDQTDCFPRSERTLNS